MGTGEEVVDRGSGGPARTELRNRVLSLPTERIPLGAVRSERRFQLRSHLREDRLEELAASIQLNGVLCPPLLVRAGDGYEVVAGARRVEGARRAGLETIEARVFDRIEKAEGILLALSENLFRDGLSRFETALACHRLSRELNWPYARISEATGLRGKTVQRLIAIIERAGGVLKDALDRGLLAYSQALPLLRLAPEKQDGIVRAAIANRWGRRRIAAEVRRSLREERKARGEALAALVGELPPFVRAWKATGNDGFLLSLPFRSREELLERLNVLTATIRKKPTVRGASADRRRGVPTGGRK